ncbi:hypothetical protein Tco_0024595 [Tanacetum coccineum]
MLTELKAKEAMLAELKAKKAMLAELKAKEAMLAEVVQVSSDEDDSGNEDPTASTSTRSKALIASTKSRAPIASTSNPQVASTALRGYMKISMTRCVLTLFAPNASPPSAKGNRKMQFDCIRGCLDLICRVQIANAHAIQIVQTATANAHAIQILTLESQIENAKWHEHLAFDLQSAV